MNPLVIAIFVLVVVWGCSTWLVLSTGRGVSPLQGWMVGISFFIVLPLTVIVFNGGYTLPIYYGADSSWSRLDLSDDRFVGPFFYIWANLIVVALTAAYLRREGLRDRWPGNHLHINASRLNRAVLVCSGLTLLDMTLNIYLHGGLVSFFRTHWYTRNKEFLETYGQAYVFYTYVVQGLQLVLTAAGCLCLLRKLQTGQGGRPLAIVVVVLGLNMAFSGNRIFFALFLLFSGTAVIFHRRYRTLAKMLLMAPVLVLVFGVWAQIRGALSDPVAAIGRHIEAANTYEGSYVLNRVLDVTEGGSINFLFNVITDFGQHYQYLSGQTFLKTLVFWIPRSVYPDKPESFTVIAANLYDPSAETSASTTVIGELFGNFGYFTIVLLPLITVAIELVDRWVSARLSRNAMLCTVLFLVCAWLARATFSDNIVLIGFSALLVWMLRLDSGLVKLARAGSTVARSRFLNSGKQGEGGWGGDTNA